MSIVRCVAGCTGVSVWLAVQAVEKQKTRDSVAPLDKFGCGLTY